MILFDGCIGLDLRFKTCFDMMWLIVAILCCGYGGCMNIPFNYLNGMLFDIMILSIDLWFCHKYE